MTGQEWPPTPVLSPSATLFPNTDTGGLGAIYIDHPDGAFEPSPATRIALKAIGQCRDLLRGVGVDWGCGPGTLAIGAARLTSVELVFGLDINPINVAAAAINAVINGVSPATRFGVADSFRASDAALAARIANLRGRMQFVVANPPASIGDDGFAFRRQVLAESEPYLAPGGVVLLSVSEQYGPARLAELVHNGVYRPLGVLASSDLAPFDLTRPDLRRAIDDYRAAEAAGAPAYQFPTGSGRPLSASEALAHFNATGESPLTRWQVHGFERLG